MADDPVYSVTVNNEDPENLSYTVTWEPVDNLKDVYMVVYGPNGYNYHETTEDVVPETPYITIPVTDYGNYQIWLKFIFEDNSQSPMPKQTFTIDESVPVKDVFVCENELLKLCESNGKMTEDEILNYLTENKPEHTTTDYPKNVLMSMKNNDYVKITDDGDFLECTDFGKKRVEGFKNIKANTEKAAAKLLE